MQIIVDHIEDDYLVVELEDLSTIDVPRALIPNAKEGDVVDVIINEEATNDRRKEVHKLMDELFTD